MQDGVEGLLRGKTRKPGKPPLPPETMQRVVDLALGPPPGETTHSTGRMLAKAAGVSSPDGASNAASCAPSSTFKPPSTASSRNTMPTPSHSSGPPIPTASSPLSSVGSKS